ncbi:hypothetical protein LOTGIDRAFT_163505 [Lottia gigantea]|uniref:Protein BANP n=1 Tax=Lottia gigantea TaxID=225164 RepID=V4BQ46_LOTGI|nr:hypothetical protein LOTGIDRAFT_163505 [Lottia gigantea]ESO90994.1 hypothetical protein LOTGIDRAFT_163505 [Lottia gigantea]
MSESDIAATAGNPNIHIVSIESSQVNQFEEGNTISEADLNIVDESGEPPMKRFKVEMNDDLDMDQSLKLLLLNINRAICLRLDNIDKKLDNLDQKTKYIQNRLDQITIDPNTNKPPQSNSAYHNIRKGAVIVGLPQNGKAPSEVLADNVNSTENVQSLGPNVTLITLNSESDFPNGCWLGDENNPEMRVRTPISKSDLLHIHSNCRTSEKMALTLLDYLFDRDTQANSNLSGMGRHGKKQLDPLMIYGIRCHLIHRFNISEGDWHRIKQNIDSKCRTAFRRRQRGQPLTVKAFRGKGSTGTVGSHMDMIEQHHFSDEDSLSHDDSVSELHIHQSDVDIQQAMQDGLGQGEIQILHATPEQISQLQQAHHIQILQGDQVIGQLQSGDMASLADSGIQVATVTTESGEVLHIQQSANPTTDTITEATELPE